MLVAEVTEHGMSVPLVHLVVESQVGTDLIGKEEILEGNFYV